MENITNLIIDHAGGIALWLVLFTKLANLTPTKWDNNALEIISKVIFSVFSILGLKVPEIEEIKNGKILTTVDVAAKEAVKAAK